MLNARGTRSCSPHLTSIPLLSPLGRLCSLFGLSPWSRCAARGRREPKRGVTEAEVLVAGRGDNGRLAQRVTVRQDLFPPRDLPLRLQEYFVRILCAYWAGAAPRRAPSSACWGCAPAWATPLPACPVRARARGRRPRQKTRPAGPERTHIVPKAAAPATCTGPKISPDQPTGESFAAVQSPRSTTSLMRAAAPRAPEGPRVSSATAPVRMAWNWSGGQTGPEKKRANSSKVGFGLFRWPQGHQLVASVARVLHGHVRSGRLLRPQHVVVKHRKADLQRVASSADPTVQVGIGGHGRRHVLRGHVCSVMGPSFPKTQSRSTHTQTTVRSPGRNG